MYVRDVPDEAAANTAASEQHSYLRRNIFGMRPTVEAMVSLGMAFWSPNPAWPRLPAELSWDDPAHFDVEGEPVSAEAKAHQEACDRTRRTHGETRTSGIPSHKFTTNDGWIVTREECRQALAAYHAAREAGADHPEWLHDDVVPFLEVAARHDGFEVW